MSHLTVVINNSYCTPRGILKSRLEVSRKVSAKDCDKEEKVANPEQGDSSECQKERIGLDSLYQRNYLSVTGLFDKVMAVLKDQSKRGQVLELCEREARSRCPNSVLALLGA